MAATKQDISRWFDEGVAQEATHMIIVCDTYDYSDYPVFVKPDEDVREVAEAHDGPNMTRLMEVYCLTMDKAEQLAEDRAFHYEAA